MIEGNRWNVILAEAHFVCLFLFVYFCFLQFTERNRDSIFQLVFLNISIGFSHARVSVFLTFFSHSSVFLFSHWFCVSKLPLP